MLGIDASSREFVTFFGILAAGVTLFAVTVMVWEPAEVAGPPHETAAIAASFAEPGGPALRLSLRN